MSSTTTLPSYKTSLLTLALDASILTFAGPYTLKSGRLSPYFINIGLFSRARLIRALSSAYAQCLHSHYLQDKTFEFDVLFGPAYKGIPLAATTAEKLAGMDEGRYGDVGYSFNRKEVKDHGEGGLIVGQPLKGKRVVVVDDVMTAGTAIREAVSIIRSQGGTLVGVVVAVDREERMPDSEAADGMREGSTVEEVRKEYGVPVLAVLTLSDVIEGMRGMGKQDEVKAMEEYRGRYGVKG